MKPFSSPSTLLRSLHRFVVVGLIGMLGIVIAVQIYGHYENFAGIAGTLREQHLHKQKAMIKREVERVVERIQYRKAKLKELASEKAAARVKHMVVMVRNMLHESADTPPSSEIRRRILDALAAMRFDKTGGYPFVLDGQGVILAHPDRPELVGKSVLHQTDTRGNYYVKELLSIVDQQHSGSLEYTYSKPRQEGEDFAKVSYVQQIPELGWIVGTGIYLDDLEQEEKVAILDEIQHVRYGKNGYLFVDDWQGVVLAHGAQPNLVGENIWEYEDSNGIKVVQGLIAAAKTPDGQFIHYSWRKPDSGEERPKVSFSMGIHDWQWMIGTGVYTDDYEGAISELEQTLVNRNLVNVLGTLVGGGLVGLMLIAWIRLIYGDLQSDLERFRIFFRKAPSSRDLMDEDGLRLGEFRLQAGYVNEMLSAKLEADQRLHDQQVHLEQLVEERTWRLQEKTEELGRMADTDALTGLLNRRSFSERASAKLREYKRYSGDCCLVLLDIDRFKSVNDQYGHSAGDQLLRAVADRLGSELREVDLFARWGGEEFTILLPQTSQEEAMVLCRRMQMSLSGQAIGPVKKITASFGLTSLREEEELEVLVKRADKAMYAAKNAGRNRIEIAP